MMFRKRNMLQNTTAVGLRTDDLDGIGSARELVGSQRMVRGSDMLVWGL